MAYESDLSNTNSKLFYDTKNIIEGEVFRVLQQNMSYVMAVKLISFENRTGDIVASLIVVMNETAVVQFNVTKQQLFNSMMNGTFGSFAIDRTFDFDIRCKILLR